MLVELNFCHDFTAGLIIIAQQAPSPPHKKSPKSKCGFAGASQKLILHPFQESNSNIIALSLLQRAVARYNPLLHQWLSTWRRQGTLLTDTGMATQLYCSV